MKKFVQKEYTPSAGNGIPKEEQETVINYSRNDDIANVWTSDTLVIRKIQKFLAKDKPEWSLVNESRDSDGRVVVLECNVPKKAIRLLAKVQKGAPMTDEQKRLNTERLKFARAKNGGNVS